MCARPVRRLCRKRLNAESSDSHCRTNWLPALAGRPLGLKPKCLLAFLGDRSVNCLNRLLTTHLALIARLRRATSVATVVRQRTSRHAIRFFCNARCNRSVSTATLTRLGVICEGVSMTEHPKFKRQEIQRALVVLEDCTRLLDQDYRDEEEYRRALATVKARLMASREALAAAVGRDCDSASS